MKIPEELEWLARNVDEWQKGWNYLSRLGLDRWEFVFELCPFSDRQWFCEKEFIWARKQLGLDQPEVTDAEEEEWQRMDKEQSRQQYSAYYKDVRHIEYIDVYRTVDLFGCEKHGHPISHAAKKLLLTGARTGGKDVEEDVREAIDSLYRWLEMREEDKRAL